MAVLDSSAIIHILAGTKDGAIIKEKFGSQAISTTVINVNEILTGLKKEKIDSVNKFLQSLEILPLDTRSAFKSVEIEESLSKKGKTIGKLDIFIGAICLTHDLQLITTDKDFKNIDELKLLIP